MTDAVAIQLISSVATVATVLVTGWFNRKTTRDNAKDIHNKIDTMAQNGTGDSKVLGKSGAVDANVPLPQTKEPLA